MMQAGDTITVKGQGGYVFDMDVPAEGTVHREVFDDAVNEGRLKVLAGGDDEATEDGPPAVSAKVGEWRDYAISAGMDPEEVESATKKDLIAAFTTDDEATEGPDAS